MICPGAWGEPSVHGHYLKTASIPPPRHLPPILSVNAGLPGLLCKHSIRRLQSVKLIQHQSKARPASQPKHIQKTEYFLATR